MTERGTKGRRSKADAGKHETYETLAELAESLELHVVATERYVGADPRHRGSLDSRLMKSQTKDLGSRASRGDPHANSKASVTVTSSSVEYAEARKIASKSSSYQCCSSRINHEKPTC